MKRALVIGGRGYLGQQVVRGVKALPGWKAVVGSRSQGGPDLNDPGTFEQLGKYTVVVNCSDSTLAPPDAAAAWCLEHGARFIETTSEPATIRRLLADLRDRSGPGLVVLGGGIFTGLSNVIAGEAARGVQGCRQLELGIRFSPLARGGAGMVELALAFMVAPSIRFEGGQAISGPPVGPGPRLPFPSGQRATLALPFAESVMLATSTGVPDIGVYMGPAPAILGPSFRAIPAGWGEKAWFQTFFRAYLSLVRRVLLRWRTSPVELVAVATGEGGSRTLGASVQDGMRAAGFLAAAKVATLPEGAKGLKLPDELWEARLLVEVSNRIADETARVVLTG